MSTDKKVENIPKSLSSGSIFSKTVKLPSTKLSTDIFRKIHQQFRANTCGENPKVIYKKSNKENMLSEIKFKQTDNSDGGYFKKKNYEKDKIMAQSMRNMKNFISADVTSKLPNFSKTTRISNSDSKKKKPAYEVGRELNNIASNKSESNMINSKRIVSNRNSAGKSNAEHHQLRKKHKKNKLSEEDKKAQMDELFENAVVGYVKHFNSVFPKQGNDIDRKLKYLEENGVIVNESALMKEAAEEEQAEKPKENQEEEKSYDDFALEENENKEKESNANVKKA